jgi:hypothetical protein
VSDALFALSFLLSLATTAGLWRATALADRRPGFWRLLALAWSLTVSGNVAWITYELWAGVTLPTLTWIDALYLARYGLIGLALWSHPRPWPVRRAGELAGVLVACAALAWLLFLRPVWTSTGGSWTHFLGVAIYPVLDVGLIYLAWRRWQGTRASPFGSVMVRLLSALGAYGVANWINFRVRMSSLEANSLLATAFWLSSDALALLATLAVRRPTEAVDEAMTTR